MSIKAYLGRMGSGKTYEVVSVVIFGALSRGRRVVTNIAGLNYDLFVEMIVAAGIDSEKIGALVSVSHEDVLQPHFWRTDKDESLGIEAIIQPGDLVVLDEIWRFWEGFGGKGMSDRVMNFVRMHRHFTDEKSGLACDLALITQDVGDISRRVRAVIEESFRMVKLTAVGASSRYRVDVFTGSRIVKLPLRQLYRTYDKQYFDLYKSHSQAKEGGAGPKEENFDNRGNLLKSALFTIVIPLGLLVLIGAVFIVYRFFVYRPVAAAVPPSSVLSSSAESAFPGAPGAPSGLVKSGLDGWRLLGYLQKGGNTLAVIDDGRFMRVFAPAAGFVPSSISVSATTPEGALVNTYSGGGQSGSGLIPPAASSAVAAASAASSTTASHSMDRPL